MTVQRNIRLWLLQRRVQKQLLVHQWEKYEQGVNRPKSHKSGSVHPRDSKPENTAVPETVKLVIVGGVLAEKVKGFAASREVWKSQCKELEIQRSLVLEEDPLAQLPPIEFPPEPRFSVVLNAQELATLAQLAEKKRARWDRMVRDFKHKHKTKPMHAVP